MDLTTQKYEASFVWYRFPLGYQWEDCEPCDVWGTPVSEWDEDQRRTSEILDFPIPEGPYLTEANLRFRTIPWEPLDNPLLFVEFADLLPTGESFLLWANKYGRLIDIEADPANPVFILSRYIPLGERDVAFLRNHGKWLIRREEGYYLRVRADPLSFWREKHRELSFAVMLWELCLGKDPRLNGILEWDRETERIYVNKIWKEKLGEIDFERFGRDPTYTPDCGAVRDRLHNFDPSLVRRGEGFDAVRAASLYLRQEINRQLTRYPLNVLFDTDSDGVLRKILRPTSLLSAMWYQLYLALTGDIRLRRCSLCGKWENMEAHRSSWSRHANCANYDRVKRARKKKREKAD